MQPLSRREFTVSMIGVAAAGVRVTGSTPQTAVSRSAGVSDPIAGLSLAEVSERIRTRAVSPVELVNACLARIDIYNPKLNAFITIAREAALADAQTLEAEQRTGKLRSTLHGIPIALKDNIDTAGVRTTAASAVFDD